MSNLVEDKIVEPEILDHGDPPKFFSSLVNKVLSMKEMMAKQ